MGYQHKSTFNKTEELEQQRKEILIEIDKIDNEIRKTRKKKLIIIFTIVLIVIAIIKIFLEQLKSIIFLEHHHLKLGIIIPW